MRILQKNLEVTFSVHLSVVALDIYVQCDAIRWEQVDMSSWKAIKWYTVMKTAFRTKSMKSESFIMKILNFKSDRRICVFKEIATRNSLDENLVLL